MSSPGPEVKKCAQHGEYVGSECETCRQNRINSDEASRKEKEDAQKKEFEKAAEETRERNAKK